MSEGKLVLGLASFFSIVAAIGCLYGISSIYTKINEINDRVTDGVQ
uniref:Nematode cuticle collagen N-terminal domain-containing protein n=1 Tax=Acrobeloides nanus TaxID=290746 RepID=A0A914D951_9BILA